MGDDVYDEVTEDEVDEAVERRRPTWDQIQRALSEQGFEQGEYAGVAIPLPGLHLMLAEGHPMKARLEAAYLERPGDETAVVCTSDEINEETFRRNLWFSRRLNSWVEIYQVGSKVEA